MTFTVSCYPIQAGGSFVHNGAGRLEVAPRAPLFGKVGRRLYLLRVRRAPGFISIRAQGASGEKETTSNLIEISYAGDPDFDWSPRSDNKNSSIQGLTAFLTIPEISYAGDPDFDWSPRSDKKSSEFTSISSIKPRVIVIAGPTAVGKTRLSIELAKTLGGEIINADSVQVYQGLDVGAAKISVEEREGIPHHLLDMVPPTVEYPYEQFYVDARAATDQILAKGLVPIVVGGTGMYMRWYMHSIQGITSHPFDGEDVTGEFDGCSSGSADWDFDFQCYFLYQHRADLFQRVDIRCEQMVPALLEETSWLLGTGVRPDSNAAARAIGYEEAMALLLRARENEGIITEKEFLDFFTDFQSNSKDLVRKQIKWFRNPKRSEVRLFRWTDATKPVDEMVRAIMSEYKRPLGQPTELADGEIVRAASLKEQKRLKGYRPTLKIFSCPEARYRILEWVRRTQGRLSRAS